MLFFGLGVLSARGQLPPAQTYSIKNSDFDINVQAKADKKTFTGKWISGPNKGKDLQDEYGYFDFTASIPKLDMVFDCKNAVYSVPGANCPEKFAAHVMAWMRKDQILKIGSEPLDEVIRYDDHEAFDKFTGNISCKWNAAAVKENVGAENRDEWMLTSLRFKGNSLTGASFWEVNGKPVTLHLNKDAPDNMCSERQGYKVSGIEIPACKAIEKYTEKTKCDGSDESSSTESSASTTDDGFPSWLLPVAIGAGACCLLGVIIGIAVTKMKKKPAEEETLKTIAGRPEHLRTGSSSRRFQSSSSRRH
jgi:hypothetical protein